MNPRTSRETVIAQRERQIAFGKATLGYARYIECVSRDQRTRSDPVTPRANTDVSRRQFRRLVNTWRRALHEWDSSVEANPA